jgi:hypothetical protein
MVLFVPWPTKRVVVRAPVVAVEVVAAEVAAAEVAVKVVVTVRPMAMEPQRQIKFAQWLHVPAATEKLQLEQTVFTTMPKIV